jgi:hypothetical protein
MQNPEIKTSLDYLFNAARSRPLTVWQQNIFEVWVYISDKAWCMKHILFFKVPSNQISFAWKCY